MADLMNRVGGIFTQNVANKTASTATGVASGDNSFAEMLKTATGELNEIQDQGEKAVVDMSTGEVKDLHNAALALNRAEMSMKLMLEVRNKAISAYKEIQRTQL